MTTIAISASSGPPTVEAPKAWIDSRIPERTRKVPEQRQREGAADQGHVPDPQHPPPLLDHDRVQEGGADEPRHQRGVLDRVPPPVAAPAELRVRPAGAEQDADPQEQPGDQREAAGGADPARVEPPGDQGADRERERDREEDVARVEHRRVDRHRRVAEQRVEPDALGRHRVEAGERVGVEQHQAGEEDAEPHQHRGRPGRASRAGPAAVEALFAALGNEDAIGVMESLPPGERDVLLEPMVATVGELQRLGLLDSFALEDVPGADIEVDGLTLAATNLGEGVTKVRVTGGTITGTVIPDEVPIGPRTRELAERRAAGRSTIERRLETESLADADLELVAIEEDGGWHVSLFYTIAEAARGDDTAAPGVRPGPRADRRRHPRGRRARAGAGRPGPRPRAGGRPPAAGRDAGALRLRPAVPRRRRRRRGRRGRPQHPAGPARPAGRGRRRHPRTCRSPVWTSRWATTRPAGASPTTGPAPRSVHRPRHRRRTRGFGRPRVRSLRLAAPSPMAGSIPPTTSSWSRSRRRIEVCADGRTTMTVDGEEVDTADLTDGFDPSLFDTNLAAVPAITVVGARRPLVRQPGPDAVGHAPHLAAWHPGRGHRRLVRVDGLAPRLGLAR